MWMHRFFQDSEFMCVKTPAGRFIVVTKSFNVIRKEEKTNFFFNSRVVFVDHVFDL